MKYNVHLEAKKSGDVTVEASSPREAVEKALEVYEREPNEIEWDVDFTDQCEVEDQQGNVWGLCGEFRGNFGKDNK